MCIMTVFGSVLWCIGSSFGIMYTRGWMGSNVDCGVGWVAIVFSDYVYSGLDG